MRLNCSECQNKNKKTIYVHNMFWDVVFMYWTGKSMNNLILFCGLVDPRISASDKDLPELEGVPWGFSRDWPGKPFDCTEFCTPKIIENLLSMRMAIHLPEYNLSFQFYSLNVTSIDDDRL